MIYEFVHETDESRSTEIDFPAAFAPRIGEVVEHEGERWRRVASLHLDAGIARRVHGYPRASAALPKNLAGCDTDKRGRPIITSRIHERELTKRYDLREFD